MKKQKVSSAVIRRLPRYYRRLNDLHRAGVERVSSNALGASLGLTASQIRQDLSCFGEFGQQGYGYNVASLRGEVADILGMNRGHTAVILGVGNLGRALMENFHFDRTGVTLTAAFDVSPDVVGRAISGVQVHPVEQLEAFLARQPASIGVLTVPRSAAPAIAERLARSGVKGIWNFTNIELTVSVPGVVIEDVHFADSLLALNYMISEEP